MKSQSIISFRRLVGSSPNLRKRVDLPDWSGPVRIRFMLNWDAWNGGDGKPQSGEKVKRKSGDATTAGPLLGGGEVAPLGRQGSKVVADGNARDDRGVPRLEDEIR